METYSKLHTYYDEMMYYTVQKNLIKIFIASNLANFELCMILDTGSARDYHGIR